MDSFWIRYQYQAPRLGSTRQDADRQVSAISQTGMKGGQHASSGGGGGWVGILILPAERVLVLLEGRKSQESPTKYANAVQEYSLCPTCYYIWLCVKTNGGRCTTHVSLF